MINRVTENMKFNTLTGSLFNVQGKAAELMEKISTQKNINRPSDDPIGANKVLNYTSIQASIAQYQTNITNAKAWLSLTDTNLEGIKNIVTQAKSIAVGASEDTMDSNALTVSSLIDDALSLMNAKSGDNYLFSGSKTDAAPFSANPAGAGIGAASKVSGTFDGTVTSGGAYTGTTDKTYQVKIIDGGTPATLTNASYQISSDGGLTWGATKTDLSGTTALGDGITMTFTAGTQPLSANDLFTVSATAPTAHISSASAATANKFNGTVLSNGTYTGTENKTYALKIIGGTLTNASYQVSSDGGKTWDSTINAADLSAGVTLGDNIKMTFTAAGAGAVDVAANDLFTVDAYPAGYYQGNNDELTVQVGKGNNFSYNITGAAAFTASGPGTVNLLATLRSLKSALEAHDDTAVSAQVDNLSIAHTQVLQAQTKAGAKAGTLTNTSSRLTSLNEQMTSLKSGIDDVDLSKLIVSYQMEQTAMEASYNMAAKIGKLSILDYL